MLDREKITKLSESLFLGKKSQEIEELFDKNGGKCSFPKNGLKKTTMICSINRHWKLKNIGAPFDTSNWPEPAVQFLFDFNFSPAAEVASLNLLVIDITAPRAY